MSVPSSLAVVLVKQERLQHKPGNTQTDTHSCRHTCAHGRQQQRSAIAKCTNTYKVRAGPDRQAMSVGSVQQMMLAERALTS